MKKKIISLILVLIMSVSVLAGCNLFSPDLESYYNAVVASVNYSYTLNDKSYNYSDEITKRELLTAYNSYGYNYYQNSGYTKEQAIETTLNTIIERKLQMKAVENYFEEKGEQLFSDSEKTYIWEQTLESVYTNLRTYYNDILGIDDEEETSDSTPGTVFEDFEKVATLKYDESTNLYLVKKTSSVSTIRYDGEIKFYEDLVYDYEYKNADGEYTFKNLIYQIIQNYTKDANFKSAFNQYTKDVKDNYSYMTFENDKDAFYFEMDRVYGIVRDNYVAEKYEEIFNETAKQGSTLTNVRAEAILNYYANAVKLDYAKYANNQSGFDTDIVSSSNEISYIYEGNNATNYFNVAVIKLSNFGYKDGYTPADALADLENGKIDNNAYNAELENIYNGVYVNEKDSSTGLETGNKVYAQTLLNDIKKDMDKFSYLDLEEVLQDTENVKLIVADAGKDYNTLSQNEIEEIVSDYVNEQNTKTSYKVADAFIKYFYYYNDDATYLNAEKNAVFGVTADGKAVYGSDFSDVNEDFENAIVALYNNGEAQVGDTSQLIRTDNGIYILFYAGEVKNVFEGITNSFSLAYKDILVLANTRLNIFSEKTIFDDIYDTLFSDSLFDVFQTENIKYLKKSLTTGEEKGIIKYPDEYKDLF